MNDRAAKMATANFFVMISLVNYRNVRDLRIDVVKFEDVIKFY